MASISKQHRRGIVIVLSAAALVGTLAATRHAIARSQAQTALDGVYGLDARVDGAELSVMDRHLSLEGLVINPVLSETPEDMVRVEHVDIYLHGSLLPWAERTAQVTLVSPQFHLLVSDDPERAQASLDARTIEELRALSPWPIDEIYIEDGHGRFIDPKRHFDINFSDLSVSVEHLVRAQDPFAAIDLAESQVLEEGCAEIDMSVKLEESATFDLKGASRLDGPNAPFDVHFTLSGFPLKEVEPMVYHDEKIEVEDGYVAINAQMHGSDGHLRGWLAPNFEKVDFEGKLRDGFAAPLNALGEKAKSKVLEDPIRPSKNNRIHVAGTYGERGLSLHATKKHNTLVQRLLFDAGAERLGS